MPYLQVTRAQLRQLIRDNLGNAANTFWRDDEINISVLQPSLRFFNLITGFWKTRAIINTVANQAWYPLPSSITSSLRISWRDSQLTSSSFYDLDYGRAFWENEPSATGVDVPLKPRNYGIGALNLIAIWPQDPQSGNSLVIDGIASTPILSTDASFLDLGQEELSGLLNCCQVLAVFKEGGKEFEDSIELFKQWLKAASERNGMLLASATFRKFLGLDMSRRQKPYKIAERSGAR